eukprot:g67445.t1
MSSLFGRKDQPAKRKLFGRVFGDSFTWTEKVEEKPDKGKVMNGEASKDVVQQEEQAEQAEKVEEERNGSRRWASNYGFGDRRKSTDLPTDLPTVSPVSSKVLSPGASSTASTMMEDDGFEERHDLEHEEDSIASSGSVRSVSSPGDHLAQNGGEQGRARASSTIASSRSPHYTSKANNKTPSLNTKNNENDHSVNTNTNPNPNSSIADFDTFRTTNVPLFPAETAETGDSETGPPLTGSMVQQMLGALLSRSAPTTPHSSSADPASAAGATNTTTKMYSPTLHSTTLQVPTSGTTPMSPPPPPNAQHFTVQEKRLVNLLVKQLQEQKDKATQLEEQVKKLSKDRNRAFALVKKRESANLVAQAELLRQKQAVERLLQQQSQQPGRPAQQSAQASPPLALSSQTQTPSSRPVVVGGDSVPTASAKKKKKKKKSPQRKLNSNSSIATSTPAANNQNNVNSKNNESKAGDTTSSAAPIKDDASAVTMVPESTLKEMLTTSWDSKAEETDCSTLEDAMVDPSPADSNNLTLTSNYTSPTKHDLEASPPPTSLKAGVASPNLHTTPAQPRAVAKLKKASELALATASFPAADPPSLLGNANMPLEVGGGKAKQVVQSVRDNTNDNTTGKNGVASSAGEDNMDDALVSRWESLLKEGRLDASHKELLKDQEVLDLLWTGLPNQLRPQAWLAMAKVEGNAEERVARYRVLLAEAERRLPRKQKEHIRRDLHRTFPSQGYFSTEAGRDAFGRILRVFAPVATHWVESCACSRTTTLTSDTARASIS